MKKTKYFFGSDLHGMRLSVLVSALEKNKFNKEKDTLVLAGDLTDGLGYDNELIAYIVMLDKIYNCVIAIRGNHDPTHNDGHRGSPKEYVQHLNRGSGWELTESNFKWLADLPTQYENEHFRLAHGIFLEEEYNWEDEVQKNNASIWGSPVLIGTGNLNDWWWIDKRIADSICKNHKSVELYSEHYGDKDMYLGHFSFDALHRYAADKIKVVGGWVKINRITWLDKSVISTKGKGFELYVKEY